MEIPEELRQFTQAREGSKGVAWLASLPDLVDELLQHWNCVPDGPVASGKVGIVVPAKSASHGEVALKVSFPHPANLYEPDAYETWQGHGAVALLERDDTRFAMLLERIGPSKPYEVLPVDEAMAVAGALVRRLAVPAPSNLPRLTAITAEWTETIGRVADRTTDRLPASVVDAALETVWDLCSNQPDTMVHGDLHFNNVLRGVREPWQVIDPRGFAGDPAYDAITLLRTTAVGGRELGFIDPDDFEPGILRWLTIFAEAAELDRDHVRRWAQARCLANAQFLRERNRQAWVRGAHDQIAVLLA
ncbi:hypothetical protein GCM10023317_50180 [Actinopolymorpha pittospori]